MIRPGNGLLLPFTTSDNVNPLQLLYLTNPTASLRVGSIRGTGHGQRFK